MDVPEQELLALALEGNANAEEGVVALCGGPVVVGKVLGSFWEKESYHVIVKVNFFFFFTYNWMDLELLAFSHLRIYRSGGNFMKDAECAE